jgi:hypothetical protein
MCVSGESLPALADFYFHYLEKKNRKQGWFISENKTAAHPLGKYLVFEMPNLSAKKNFGLEKQAPCKIY